MGLHDSHPPAKDVDRVILAAPRDAATMAARRGAKRSTVLLYSAVAAGCVIGSSLRYVVGALQQQLGFGFPWGTLFVNVTGSFLIGFYAALTGPDGRFVASPHHRQFFMTGICGGYTTFSTFSLETLRLIQMGDPMAAGLNVAASMLGSLVAVWVGYALATLLNRLRR